MKEIEIPEILSSYIKELNLEWRIRTFVVDTQMPRIISNKNAKEHQIWASPVRWEKTRECLFELVHELVHAWMVETVDPIFGACYFSSAHKRKDKDFQEMAWLVHLAQSHVDVWVADRMTALKDGLELVREDIETWLQAVRIVPREILVGQGMINVIGWSITWADAIRRGYKKYKNDAILTAVRISRILDDIKLKTIRRLGSFWSKIAPFPKERKEELNLHSRITSQSIKILDFPIEAEIVEEEGDAVWKLKRITI